MALFLVREVNGSQLLFRGERCYYADQALAQCGDHEQYATMICLANLRNTRFFALALEFEVYRLVQNYLFSLGRGDSVPCDVLDF